MITYGLVYKLFIILIFIPFIIKNIKKRKTFYYHIAFLGFVLYIVTLVGILFFPLIYDKSVFIDSSASNLKLNLIPLNTILDIFKNNFMVFKQQILGNVLIFIPMGFFIPLFFRRFNKLRNFLILVLLTSISVELSQLLLDFILIRSYRSCDIDDVILNTIGGLLGFAILLIGNKLFKLSEKLD